MQEANPLISVIIPIYNVERYLEQCLQSVVTQSYQKIEIVCVIDGSVDGSSVIAERFSADDERIRIIYQENQGLSSARNIGVVGSTGDYIFFLDSDDWLDEKALEHLIHGQSVSGAAIISGGVMEYDDETHKTQVYWKAKKRRLGKLNLLKVNFFALEVMVWNKLYRRDVVVATPFTFNLTHEDVDFYWRIFSSCPIACSIAQTVVYYRRRQGTLSNPKAYAEDYQNHFICIVDHAHSIVKIHPSLRFQFERKTLKYLELIKDRGAPYQKYEQYINQKFGVKDTRLFYAWMHLRKYFNFSLG